MKALEIALFWMMTLVAVGFFAWTMRQRLATLKAGLPVNRFDQPWVRLKGVFTLAIMQKRMVRDKYAGLYHILIFWGFCVLALRSVGLVVEGLFPAFHMTEALGGFGYGYQATKDVFEVLVLVGLGLSAFRRLVMKPWRLENSADAWATLSLIGGLMVTDLLADGAFVAMHHPTWASWSPAGTLVAGWLAGLSQG